MQSILQVSGLTKKFGGLTANDDITFEVNRGEIVSIIGPNGAGKTTFFNCLTGFQRITSGSVIFEGRRIDQLSAPAIAKLGLVRTFQIVQTFAGMSVAENVIIGALMHTRNVEAARKRAADVLAFTGLSSKKDVLGKNLTIADKKRLEIARALASDPKLLLLDECVAGLNPNEVKEAVELLKRIIGAGITLLIVEHVMEVIMPISSRVVVLDSGKKIAEGRPQEIAADERVIKAYLGDRYDA
ncbi:MAG: Lipopolysaccharide export system ATP-binding protein LptB [Syntrophorhabdus sp. PtaU1.Bin058]|nr:MAG: Lipopolysaccharide export system ATP-binding protein LptB [Syntrophorhabdus sp. PtaU1.Bin058]